MILVVPCMDLVPFCEICSFQSTFTVSLVLIHGQNITICSYTSNIIPFKNLEHKYWFVSLNCLRWGDGQPAYNPDKIGCQALQINRIVKPLALQFTTIINFQYHEANLYPFIIIFHDIRSSRPKAHSCLTLGSSSGSNAVVI